MHEFEEYLKRITDEQHREQMYTILNWITQTFPQLTRRIAWNQPVFCDHGTFIIGLSMAKQHMAIAPEIKGMEQFCEAIQKAGYSQTQTMYRIKWKDVIDYDLLKDIILYNIEDKKGCKTFWRT